MSKILFKSPRGQWVKWWLPFQKDSWLYIVGSHCIFRFWSCGLQWHNIERNVVWNHWCLDCLLNHLFRGRSKKTSKLHITCLCEGNSLVTSEFPTQRASNVENSFDDIIMWGIHGSWKEGAVLWETPFTRIIRIISMPSIHSLPPNQWTFQYKDCLCKLPIQYKDYISW